MSHPQQKANLSDLVRALACIAVITLHVLFKHGWKDEGTVEVWWLTDILHAIAKPAVPLFVMISGAYLLDPAKELRLWPFWKKRLAQIYLPFLAWSGVYALDEGIPLNRGAISEHFLDEDIAPHLWFVYMLVGLYLILPLLKCITRHYQTKGAAWYTALWFVGIVAASAMGVGDPSGFAAQTAAFSGYFMGGYLLRKSGAIPSKILVVGIPLIIAANATISHILQARTDAYFDEDYSMMSDVGPTVALFSFLAFAGLQQLTSSRVLQGVRVNRIVRTLASASFGIYLAHPLVQKQLAAGCLGFSLDGTTWSPYFGIPVSILSIASVTLGLLYLLQKVPGIKMLVGYRDEVARDEPRPDRTPLLTSD